MIGARARSGWGWPRIAAANRELIPTALVEQGEPTRSRASIARPHENEQLLTTLLSYPSMRT